MQGELPQTVVNEADPALSVIPGSLSWSFSDAAQIYNYHTEVSAA